VQVRVLLRGGPAGAPSRSPTTPGPSRRRQRRPAV